MMNLLKCSLNTNTDNTKKRSEKRGMDEKGNIHKTMTCAGDNPTLNFLADSRKKQDDHVNHFKTKITCHASMVSDYFGLENKIFCKNMNRIDEIFSCKDTTEMRKLINHLYKMEHLIIMYCYLSEYLMYNELSFDEFNCIKEMIYYE